MVKSEGKLQEESLNVNSELQGSPPGLEIKFININTDFQTFCDHIMRFRLRATVKDVEILDHITCSEYTKFMSAVVPDSNQRPRESTRDMIKLELSQFNPKDLDGIPEHKIKVYPWINMIVGSVSDQI